MSTQENQTLLQFFKGVANENRLKILGILAVRERSVEELSTLMHLEAPKVFNNLIKLQELGLVESHSDGDKNTFRLNIDALEEMNKERFTSAENAPFTENESYEVWEQKILNTFLKNDEIKAIPSSLKKRKVILNWLANKFERGVKYTEKQVNEIIARHHPDFATLRREFIMEKLMDREGGGGLYWRM